MRAIWFKSCYWEGQIGRQDTVGAGINSQSHLCNLNQSSSQHPKSAQELIL